MYGNYGSEPAYGMLGAFPPGSEAYDPQMDNGNMKSPFARGQRKNSPFIFICACVLIPWIIFTLVFSLNSLDFRYKSPDIVLIGSLLIGVLVLAQGWFAFMAWRRKGETVHDHLWYTLCFVLSCIAWGVAFFFGYELYLYYTLPYLEVQSLNTYTSVDPSMYRGQQLMDAGRIIFAPGSHLDLRKSMGFKNLEVYCVAPITIGNATSPSLESYDFWAVGTNCCSGHGTDFHCGEYLNPKVTSGLRLMRDDQRSYFRLAVQQAEAAYNIRATHPIFLHWLEDPINEINGYQETAYRYLLFGIFLFFIFQIVIVAVVVGLTGS